MSGIHILLVEFDPLLADVYMSTLDERFVVSHARDAQTAIDILDENRIDLVITDVILGRHDGIEIVHELRSHDDWLGLPVILLSSIPETDFPLEKKHWQRYGIAHFLYKPETKPHHLAQTVDNVLKTGGMAKKTGRK